MTLDTEKNTKNPKIVLHIGGGIMAGIFGAGIVTAFEEENMYLYIEAIYGSSVGVIIGSYFLAGQSRLGSRAFAEDLTHDLIIPGNILPGIYDRLWHRFVAPISYDKMRNAIDIDYAMSILTHTKQLNIDEIKRKDIPLYANVLDLKTLKAKSINITSSTDPLRIIKASMSIAPYYFSSDPEYIDGAIENYFPVTDILNKHPDSKIFSIMNLSYKRPIGHFFKSLFEGAVASLMYPIKIWRVYVMRDFITRRKIKEEQRDTHMRMIYPPRDLALWPNTMKREKLARAYQSGIEEGKRLAGLIRSGEI